jgi:membrane fusion protein, multidrug efflux system
MKYGRRALYIASVIAALAAFGCERPGARPNPPRAVRIETVVAMTQASTARYSGTVLAHTQVDLAFRVSGYVQTIASLKGGGRADGKVGKKERGRLLQAGDPVTRDMMLAALRKEDFKQKYSELAGMSAEASAGYRKAKQDYDRAKGLLAENVISQADYDAAKARYDGYAGSASAAAARAGQAGLALSDSQLRSPLNGIVLDRRVEVGSLIPAGAPAFILADTSTVKVVFGVPDIVQRTLAQGQAIIVTTDAVTDRVFTAAVTKIAAQADSKTRVFDVEASLDNAEGILKVGMIASIQLGRHQEGPSIQIPLSAVIRSPNDPQGFAVFVLRADDLHAKLQPVELGNLVGNRVGVLRGLATGDQLIVQGATLLREGDAVNVVPGSVQGAPIVGTPPASGSPRGGPPR